MVKFQILRHWSHKIVCCVISETLQTNAFITQFPSHPTPSNFSPHQAMLAMTFGVWYRPVTSFNSFEGFWISGTPRRGFFDQWEWISGSCWIPNRTFSAKNARISSTVVSYHCLSTFTAIHCRVYQLVSSTILSKFSSLNISLKKSRAEEVLGRLVTGAVFSTKGLT